jgi:hypothetical protein
VSGGFSPTTTEPSPETSEACVAFGKPGRDGSGWSPSASVKRNAVRVIGPSERFPTTVVPSAEIAVGTVAGSTPGRCPSEISEGWAAAWDAIPSSSASASGIRRACMDPPQAHVSVS